MIDIGSLALALGLALAAYAVVMSLVGALRRRRDLVASAEHAAYAVWGLTVIAVAYLLQLLVTHDFNVEYVAAYSSSTLPLKSPPRIFPCSAPISCSMIIPSPMSFIMSAKGILPGEITNELGAGAGKPRSRLPLPVLRFFASPAVWRS